MSAGCDVKLAASYLVFTMHQYGCDCAHGRVGGVANAEAPVGESGND
jgi:hypothetical protein